MNSKEIREACHDLGITVYQVGQVYDNAPAEFLKKYFVAITAGDDGIAAETIPLGDTEEHAYQIAYERLILGFTNNTEKLGVSST